MNGVAGESGLSTDSGEVTVLDLKLTPLSSDSYDTTEDLPEEPRLQFPVLVLRLSLPV